MLRTQEFFNNNTSSMLRHLHVKHDNHHEHQANNNEPVNTGYRDGHYSLRIKMSTAIVFIIHTHKETYTWARYIQGWMRPGRTWLLSMVSHSLWWKIKAQSISRILPTLFQVEKHWKLWWRQDIRWPERRPWLKWGRPLLLAWLLICGHPLKWMQLTYVVAEWGITRKSLAWLQMGPIIWWLLLSNFMWDIFIVLLMFWILWLKNHWDKEL